MTERTRRILRLVALGVVGIVVYRLARTMQEGGHGWGDDFAMYVNQARGLTDGTADEVVAANRFALDNSAYHFGPVAYPWGFPALLAPIIMLKGLDYSALKLVGTLSLVGGVLLYAHLLSSRLRAWEVAVATAMVALNGWYLGWTDGVLSDLPFFCSLMVVLVLLDRLVRADRLLTARWPALAALGAAVAFSFNVRREGLVLVGAVAAAQVVRLLVLHREEQHDLDAAHGAARRPFADLVRRHARPLATPHAWFLAIALTAQFVRPATILSPREDFGPSGPQNARFNAEWYKNPLAELLGLKDVGPNPITMFGHEWLGSLALWTFLGAAVVGLVAAFVRDPRRDVHLAVTLIGVTTAVLFQPFREGRYLVTILPLLVYFALRGAHAAIGAIDLVTRRRVGLLRFVRLIVPALALLVLLGGVFSDTRAALEYHRTYAYTTWGPEAPESLEMFAAVERLTDARDVVVFYQARSMNLYTHRRAIQGNNVQMMVERGDWYAMVKDSDYIQTPLTDEDAASLGFVKVWENSVFVLWSIPDRPVVPLGS